MAEMIPESINAAPEPTTGEKKVLLDVTAETVKLSTIESAKGMEFQIVFLVGLEMLPRGDRDEPSERSLAYVGMTRTQDALYVRYCQRNPAPRSKSISIDNVAARSTSAVTAMVRRGKRSGRGTWATATRLNRASGADSLAVVVSTEGPS